MHRLHFEQRHAGPGWWPVMQGVTFQTRSLDPARRCKQHGAGAAATEPPVPESCVQTVPRVANNHRVRVLSLGAQLVKIRGR